MNAPKRLGAYAENRSIWEAHSIVHLVSRLPAREVALVIDCGLNDLFLQVNRNLHAELVLCEVPHDYTERFGGHDPDYWNNAAEYQLLFLAKYFGRSRATGP